MKIQQLGHVTYDDGLALQQSLQDAVVAGDQDDVVLLLQHEPVYTAGKRTEPWERPTDGSRVVDVDRGGRLTWHGPGQITGYPIVRLSDPVDVGAYVRRLEQVLMDVCTQLGLPTARLEGRSGVWTTDGRRKVAAIGIRVSRGVTMHGFALNVCNSLTPYDSVVACGITDAGVTTLSAELGREVTVDEVLPLLEQCLTHVLDPASTTGEECSGTPFRGDAD